MGGGKMGGRGRFWRSGPVSEAPPMGIRTPQLLPKGPSFGGAPGEGLRGPYSHKRGFKDRTGPPKPASAFILPPISLLPRFWCQVWLLLLAAFLSLGVGAGESRKHYCVT